MWAFPFVRITADTLIIGLGGVRDGVRVRADSGFGLGLPGVGSGWHGKVQGGLRVRARVRVGCPDHRPGD